MRNTERIRWRTLTFLYIVLAAMAAPAQAAHRDTAQVIIDWDQVAQQTVGGAPFAQARAYAMVSIAMADAVVAIQGKYDPFFVKLNPAAHGASATAAAAQAARDVLYGLFPANQAALDAALATSLNGIPHGPRRLGQGVGMRVAAKVLAWRANDGFAAANPQPPNFLASTLPGIWRQTTAGPAGAAQFSEIRNVEPFGLVNATQFLPVPFPQLESAEYAADFNDVKTVGSASATEMDRSVEQTALAQLFAGAPGAYFNTTNFFRVWHNVARDVSLAESMSLIDTARLFALMSASMNDSLLTSQTSKFVYRLWRPVTAVREAASDNNDATAAEADWVPLLGTPPYASHASNTSCLGTSAAQTLGNVFGTDNKPFTATWYSNASPPAVVYAKPYTSFWDMGHDTGSSRVWGGIHFRFEITASENSCTQVANYIYDNYMQRQH
jgi:hypothetical protein